MKIVFCVVILLTGVLWHLSAADIQVQDFRGKLSWGISCQKISPGFYPQLADEHFESGQMLLKIVAMVPGAAGSEEGLQAGDIILSINGQRADTFDISKAPGSRGERLEPGDVLKIKLYQVRCKKSSIVEKQCVLPGYFETEKAAYQEPGGAAEYADIPSLHQDLAKGLITEAGWEDDFQDLRQRLMNIDLFQDRYRLPVFSYLVRNPFKLEAVSRAFTRRVQEAGTVPEKLLSFSQYALSFAPAEERAKKLSFSGGDLAAHLDYMEAVLSKAAQCNAAALAKLAQTDLDYILQYRDELLDSFIAWKMLSYDSDTERVRRSLQVLRLAEQIDRNELFNQARIAAQLIAPEFLASLQQAAAGSEEKAIVATRETPFGNILIAGKTDHIHQQDYAVIYDLGGNDQYFNNQGGSIPGKIPTAVVVDIAGNDAWESTDTLTQGGGNLGVGILLDLQGDDQYIGIRNIQGAAFGGVGMLLDLSGNDIYRAIHMAQGVAFFGADILADKQGDDRYEAHQNAQAVGFVRGIGLLTDGAGNDSYYCKGSQQTGYRTRGHYEGWGQGMGFGIRPYASGGVGILFDQSGRDRFEAGTFSQGGGYYYAFGILANAGMEDDHYIGTRYAQGFGVHQALGAFLEFGGNDVYQTRMAVAQGLAWDEAIGLFIDEQGDDQYHGGSGFSLGAVSHNALCMFLDQQGNDRYEGVRPATAGSNSYHGGTSLTIFIDDGQGQDQYIKRKNSSVETEKQNSIFIDR